MKLRIISGTLGRRVLAVPAALASFRPTLERCRESVFQILEGRIRGACAADICAGSGAAGFEFISRGAARVTFVESDRRRARLIARQACVFGVESAIEVLAATVQGFVTHCTSRFDLIYYDPPYHDTVLRGLLPRIVTLLSPDGVVLYEHAATNTAVHPGTQQSRRYGDSVVDFIGPIPPDETEKEKPVCL